MTHFYLVEERFFVCSPHNTTQTWTDVHFLTPWLEQKIFCVHNLRRAFCWCLCLKGTKWRLESKRKMLSMSSQKQAVQQNYSKPNETVGIFSSLPRHGNSTKKFQDISRIFKKNYHENGHSRLFQAFFQIPGLSRTFHNHEETKEVVQV